MHLTTRAFDPARLRKPLKKVIKATQGSPDLSDPKQVHELRTNSWRVEPPAKCATWTCNPARKRKEPAPLRIVRASAKLAA